MSDALRSAVSESSTLSRVSQELAALVERAGRSTVLVGGGSFRPGTGTVVAPDLVLTAMHVVESDEGIVVRTADNRALDAVLVGRDPATGLALLRVENLDAPPITPASAEPRAGSLAAAVFRSWEGQLTARLAVVNAVAGPVRVGRGVRLAQVIRTDIGPARGLSGSPLVTTDGEWLGLITAGLVRGVPLVIPHAVAAESIKAITARGGGGRAHRGYLGVALHPVRLPERQRAAIAGGDRGESDRGVIVVGFTPDSPADRAGLLLGDVIVAAGGQPVNEIDDLHSLLLSSAVDAPLPLDVLRGTTAVKLDVIVGDRPS
jgi:S1-C subfamily serine protease